MDDRRNSRVELDGPRPAELDQSEAVGATCAILNFVLKVRPSLWSGRCAQESTEAQTDGLPKNHVPSRKQCSGQTCRQRGGSSIMRNVCRIPTAVRMPAERSPNSLSAPRSILLQASWPDQACPPLPRGGAHRRIRKQTACRAMSGRAVCSEEHPCARVARDAHEPCVRHAHIREKRFEFVIQYD